MMTGTSTSSTTGISGSGNSKEAGAGEGNPGGSQSNNYPMGRDRSREELKTATNASASGRVHNTSGPNDNFGTGAISTDSGNMGIADSGSSSVNGGIPRGGRVSTEDAISIAQSDRAALLSTRQQQRQRGNSDVGVAQGGSNAGPLPLLSPLQDPVSSRVSNIPPRKSKSVKHLNLEAPPGAASNASP